MRLIDADAFEKFIKEKYKDGESTDDIKDQVLFDLSYQPTAYDVEKVVEQISENGQKMAEAKANMPYGKSTPGCHNYYKAISVKKAIEIIRKGGVNERD